MRDIEYQDFILPVKIEVGNPAPCLDAETGKYRRSLILLCGKNNGIKAPHGLGFSDGQICAGTCFRKNEHAIPDVYLDTSRMYGCGYFNSK